MHCIALRRVALRCVALHCIALCCITKGCQWYVMLRGGVGGGLLVGKFETRLFKETNLGVAQVSYDVLKDTVKGLIS